MILSLPPMLIRALRRGHSRYAAGALLLAATQALALSIPWLLGRAVDGLRAGAPLVEISRLALLMAAAAVAQALVRTGSRLLILGYARQAVAEARELLQEHLLRLPAAFYDRARIGDLMSRAVNDLRALRNLLGPGALNALGTLLLAAAALVMMLWLDPWLTAAALLAYPFFVVLARRAVRRIHRHSRSSQERLADLTSRVEQSVTGQLQIKAFSQEEREVAAFASLSDTYRRANMELARARGQLAPIMGLLGGLGALAVLGVGGWQVATGALSLGDFVAFNVLLGLLSGPTVTLGWTLDLFQRGQAAARRIQEILDEPPIDGSSAITPISWDASDLPLMRSTEPGGSKDAASDLPLMSRLEPGGSKDAARAFPLMSSEQLQRAEGSGASVVPLMSPPAAGGSKDALPPHIRGRLELRGVEFGYATNGRGSALCGVDLSMEPGEHVAIVGPVGAGKSTLLALLAGLYDPDRGAVLLDGVPLSVWPLDSRRRALILAPQDAFLFSRSLADNVRLGRPGLRDEEVEEWLWRVAFERELASLPAGIHTLVGERGLTLSGGQRQRVALARTLAAGSPVLLLDDPLSMVDPQTEATVLDRLRPVLRGRTVVLATHRTGALERVDRIVVLERGQVVEQGAGETLAASGGQYARLILACRPQAGGGGGR